jgi:hypothetical protein
MCSIHRQPTFWNKIFPKRVLKLFQMKAEFPAMITSAKLRCDRYLQPWRTQENPKENPKKTDSQSQLTESEPRTNRERTERTHKNPLKASCIFVHLNRLYTRVYIWIKLILNNRGLLPLINEAVALHWSLLKILRCVSVRSTATPD